MKKETAVAYSKKTPPAPKKGKKAGKKKSKEAFVKAFEKKNPKDY